MLLLVKKFWAVLFQGDHPLGMHDVQVISNAMSFHEDHPPGMQQAVKAKMCHSSGKFGLGHSKGIIPLECMLSKSCCVIPGGSSLWSATGCEGKAVSFQWDHHLGQAVKAKLCHSNEVIHLECNRPCSHSVCLSRWLPFAFNMQLKKGYVITKGLSQ